MSCWPSSARGLIELQTTLAEMRPPPWRMHDDVEIGGCFVCFQRGESGPGRTGDRGWAGAAVAGATALGEGFAGAPYEAGLLALREGTLLERVVRALPVTPDVLIVNATGLDHPRRAGLALHLGAVLEIPTVGVTHRPLLADGKWPDDETGALSPLLLEGETVGYWLRTRPGRRPLAVHAAWRTDAETAVQVVLASLTGTRTPQPLRDARCTARCGRANIELRHRTT